MKYSSRGKKPELTAGATSLPPHVALGQRAGLPSSPARPASRMPAAASDIGEGRPPPSAPLSISSRYQAIVSRRVRSRRGRGSRARAAPCATSSASSAPSATIPSAATGSAARAPRRRAPAARLGRQHQQRMVHAGQLAPRARSARPSASRGRRARSARRARRARRRAGGPCATSRTSTTLVSRVHHRRQPAAQVVADHPRGGLARARSGPRGAPNTYEGFTTTTSTPSRARRPQAPRPRPRAWRPDRSSPRPPPR